MSDLSTTVPISRELLEDFDLSGVPSYLVRRGVEQYWHEQMFRERWADPENRDLIEYGVSPLPRDRLDTYVVEVEEPYIEFGSGGSYGW